MPELKILQSDLKTRPATDIEQQELDIRTEKIVKGELKDDQLFDPEPEAKPDKKEVKGKSDEEVKAEEEKQAKEESAKKVDAEILEAEDDELDDKQKARKAELVKAREILDKQEEDDRILEAKDEDLEEDELARKKELVKAKGKVDEKTEEEKKEELDKEIKAYATEYSMSEDDARADLESITKIQEKYKGDPKQLSKAALHSQRGYDKMKEDLKALKNAPPPLQSKEATMKTIVDGIEAGKMHVNGKPTSKEDVAAAYRKKNPELGEDISDDSIIKLVSRDIMRNLDDVRQENLTKLSSEAKEKKAKLIGELSEADKKYLPEVKALIDSHTDAQIMNEGYDLDDFITYAKGKNVDKLVKEAGEREYKRGVEARKILGEIKKPADGKTRTKTSVKSGKDFGLNDDQKKEAEEMFQGDNIPLSRKYELMADIVKDDEERKKKKEKKED